MGIDSNPSSNEVSDNLYLHFNFFHNHRRPPPPPKVPFWGDSRNKKFLISCGWIIGVTTDIYYRLHCARVLPWVKTTVNSRMTSLSQMTRCQWRSTVLYSTSTSTLLCPCRASWWRVSITVDLVVSFLHFRACKEVGTNLLHKNIAYASIFK